MSITSVNSSALYMPSLTKQTEPSLPNNFQKQQDSVLLSDRAKELLTKQLQPEAQEEKEKEGNESVQLSSSIGRIARVTGLQREEVAALYRSIDKLT